MGEPHLDEPVVSRPLPRGGRRGGKEGNKFEADLLLLCFSSLLFDEGRVDSPSPLKLKLRKKLKMDRMKILLRKR